MVLNENANRIGWLFILCAFMITADAEAKNIKIGIIDCYSGPSAVYAKEALNGFKLSLSEINKQKVLGKKITYIVKDTRYRADRAVKLANSLIKNKGVHVLVGTTSSEAAMAISQNISKKQKIPFIMWLSKSERITGEKGHRYVFSTGDNTAMAGKAGSLALTKKPYTKFWIAGEDTEYGHAMADAVWRNLRKKRPKVAAIGSTWWKLGEPTLKVQMRSILSAKPDATILCVGSRDISEVMRVIKEKDMAENVPIWLHTATGYSILKPLGENAPEDVMGTIGYHHYFPDIQTNKDFVFAYLGEYETLPGFPAYNGYITARFIAEAFRKADAVDKEKFVHALETLKIETPTGPIEMRACDHQAVFPLYLGVTKKSKKQKHDALIASRMKTLAGKDLMPTCEQITAVRMQ